MSQHAIIGKLQRLLAHGIRSEAEALYLVAEVRKLLEQQDAKQQYDYLTFHCDWALHARLAGTTAQRILRLFDAANVHLKAGMELHELPGMLSTEIDRISKMRYFEQQFESFLEANMLPKIESTRSDGWIHFVHFYSQIVQDCPLEIKTRRNASATIDSVTLQLELANKVEHGEVFFTVTWLIKDKSGKFGSIQVYNSFSENPHGRHAEEISPGAR